MTLLTLGKYLVGNREAILQVARSPGALGVGLLFVIAAGFAREYDGEDLLAEPWHLLIPLGASIVSSLVLYLLVRGVAWCRHETEPPLVGGYWTFLSLYWMTAPLALLYAIPFERFMSAGDATRSNLWLLALVAAWRVLLMSRVVSVLYSTSFVASLAVVMLFADSLMLLILSFIPLSIFALMGGIRFSESETAMQLAAFAASYLGILSWPFWAVGAGAAAMSSQWAYEPKVETRGRSPARHLWITALACLAAWALVLPFTQPEQRLRRQVERDLVAGRIEQALVTMSAHEPGDFPPHWDPPPRITRFETQPDIVAVQERLGEVGIKPWVRTIFDDKFVNSLRGRHYWEDLPPEEVERRLTLLDRFPGQENAVSEIQNGLIKLEGRQDLSKASRERLVRLLAPLRSGTYEDR